MTSSRNRHLAVVAVAAVACTAAGAAYAATKLHGSRGTSSGLTVGRAYASSSSTTTAPPRFDGDRHGRGRHGDELAAAATYLGITQAQLLTQLQSGKTLAQIADATSGKSAAGLIDALVAAETAELDAALKAGALTQAEHDQIVAGLKERFTAMANNARPPQGPGFGHGHGPGGDDFAAAASYLGLTPAELAAQLQSGKTLAQVADATSGKSAAGLVDALVAHETTELDNALKAGTITQAQHDQMVAGLEDRVTAMVNHTRPPGPPPHDGGMPQHAPRI
jgi:hypothetical protein